MCIFVVDGRWSSWHEWGACSATCGNGTQERIRKCEGPFHGGVPCNGPEFDGRPCFAEICPGSAKLSLPRLSIPEIISMNGNSFGCHGHNQIDYYFLAYIGHSLLM